MPETFLAIIGRIMEIAVFGPTRGNVSSDIFLCDEALQKPRTPCSLTIIPRTGHQLLNQRVANNGICIDILVEPGAFVHVSKGMTDE